VKNIPTKTLLFITGNPNKIKEAKKILKEFDIKNEPLDIPEIQELNSQLVVEEKVRQALKQLNKPLFVEDVSLCFDELNGLPGPLIKWFVKSIGRRGLVDILSPFSNKSATAKCFIGYGVPKTKTSKEKIVVFEGSIRGKIVEPTGENNFGWDPIFVPEGYEKTFAEMTEEEKNSISHRRRALEKFKEYLEKNGG
jgi:inosine triphosphate pyrophosphatase